MPRILVVEDDESMRRLIVQVPTEDSCQTDQAPDGLAALEQARGATPDLIVLDLFMPPHGRVGVSERQPHAPRLRSDPGRCGVRQRSAAGRPARAGFPQEAFDVSVLSSAVRSILTGVSQSRHDCDAF